MKGESSVAEGMPTGVEAARFEDGPAILLLVADPGCPAQVSETVRVTMPVY